MSTPPRPRLTALLSSFSLRRRRTRDSISSTVSRQSSYYQPYAVYYQTMLPAVLKDPDVTQRIFEAILESPGGKRSLSRLARTCRAICEPALNTLWRDLDSLIPLIGLFPANLLRRWKKPGMGLIKAPSEGDWKKVLAYGERVQRITYQESSNNVSASIFPILDESRPQTWILPNLTQLTWKAETSAGLERCSLFLNPGLQSLILEIGTRFKELNSFLADMSSRTRLRTFSFISPTTLPDEFTELLRPQDRLQKVTLVAPGALSPEVGRWIASLKALKTLQLDLSGRSMIAVEGFFDNIRPRSGDSTPSSVGSTDSGVFSGEEPDFSDIRKSALRLTGDLPSKGWFTHLRSLHLTGEVGNIAVFLKHLNSALAHIELVIEDPPDRADWLDLSSLINESYGDSLQSLRITATGSSRFAELIRSTSRAEPPTNHLSFENFTHLPRLGLLDIDLPESVVFFDSDILNLAKACPNLEVLKLCPLARFPAASGPPKVTLEGLEPLTKNCRRLHTIGIVLDAKRGSDDVLVSRPSSSKSLLRLSLGHSWINDPLQVTILLSHLAPRLKVLKWFKERNRAGFVEANAQGWQTVNDFLPHIQKVRLVERANGLQPYEPPETAEKSIDARPFTLDRGVLARPRVRDSAIQFSPRVRDQIVDVRPQMHSIMIDATPSTFEKGTSAIPTSSHRSVDATVSTQSKSIGMSPLEIEGKYYAFSFIPQIPVIPSISGLISSAFVIVRYPFVLIAYPLSIPGRIYDLSLAKFHEARKEFSYDHPSEKSDSSSSDTSSEAVVSPVGS